MNRAYGRVFVGNTRKAAGVWVKGDLKGVEKKARKGVEREEGRGLGAPPISTAEDQLADCPRASVSWSVEWGWGAAAMQPESGPCTRTGSERQWRDGSGGWASLRRHPRNDRRGWHNPGGAPETGWLPASGPRPARDQALGGGRFLSQLKPERSGLGLQFPSPQVRGLESSPWGSACPWGASSLPSAEPRPISWMGRPGQVLVPRPRQEPLEGICSPLRLWYVRPETIAGTEPRASV